MVGIEMSEIVEDKDVYKAIILSAVQIKKPNDLACDKCAYVYTVQARKVGCSIGEENHLKCNNSCSIFERVVQDKAKPLCNFGKKFIEAKIREVQGMHGKVLEILSGKDADGYKAGDTDDEKGG